MRQGRTRETGRYACCLQWTRVLGDLGGQVGLWLGVSLMTALEICELLVSIVLLLLAKLRRSCKTQVKTQVNTFS